MSGKQVLRLADMENRRQTPTRPSTASGFVDTRVGGARRDGDLCDRVVDRPGLPGLPLLPGVGGGTTSNVSISLSSAVLGVQDSRTFAQSNGVAGRQARLLSLLLPAPDPLGTKLATKLVDADARSAASMAVALPTGLPAPAAANNGPRVIESTQLASASHPAPAPPAPPAPQPPVSSPPPPRKPDPEPQTLRRPRLIDPPPPADTDVPSGLPGSRPSPRTPRRATEALPGQPRLARHRAGRRGNGNGNAGGNRAATLAAPAMLAATNPNASSSGNKAWQRWRQQRPAPAMPAATVQRRRRERRWQRKRQRQRRRQNPNARRSECRWERNGNGAGSGPRRERRGSRWKAARSRYAGWRPSPGALVVSCLRRQLPQSSSAG
jgi:hypothetical protein